MEFGTLDLCIYKVVGSYLFDFFLFLPEFSSYLFLLQINKTPIAMTLIHSLRTLRRFPRVVSASVSKRFISNNLISVSEEIKQALNDNTPVVALESTVITHGLKYPENLEFALAVEQTVRDNGAIPATIGFFEGKGVVGASKEQITYLAEAINDPERKPTKVSRRDIPHVLSKKLLGGTTIAGTMILANKVGIDVFATGGLGGVHRGAEINFDISADLSELGRTPVGVVCSGPKSILDIAKTMEYLETAGVYVSTYGPKGTNIPGFFAPDSGVPVCYTHLIYQFDPLLTFIVSLQFLFS
jgi:pseudouridine-5'-phosphate glycosidase/pseudouridine kinase